MHHACARGELSRLPKDIKVGFYVSIASAQELGALDAHLLVNGLVGARTRFPSACTPGDQPTHGIQGQARGRPFWRTVLRQAFRGVQYGGGDAMPCAT